MYLKKGIIDRIEGETAVVQTDDGQSLTWGMSNLPPSLSEGSEVFLEIKTKHDAEKNQQELAVQILNEIFNHTRDGKH